MAKYEIRDRYGSRVEDDEADILPDGHVLRVPLMMRDGLSPLQAAIAQDKASRVGFDDSAARHQPGPVPVVDQAALDARTEAFREMVRDMENAWRHPTPGRDSAPNAPPLVRDAAEGRRVRREAYDAMVRDMVDAWRKPAP